MRRVLLAAILGVSLFGCGRNEGPAASAGGAPGATTTSGAPKDEATTLLEQQRGGAYQIDVAMGHMEHAMNLVRPLAVDKPDETKEALQNIVDMLDSAGATIIEFNDAPTLDKIKENFKEQDDRRLKAIEEADDARQEVEQAKGIITDLLASEPPADVKTSLTEIDESIEEALDALEAAIEAFGGTVPEGGDTAQ